MNLSLIAEAFPVLVESALLTVELTIVSLAFGFVIALPLSLMRTSPFPLLAWPVQAFTFAFRGTPLLVQLFLIYYGAGQIAWIRTSIAWTLLRDPYWCALVAFSLNNAAYTVEILRGGIRSVPAGEVEAGKALGMSYILRTRRIVLPAALRIALPAYANETVLMLKASSLASTITLMEITGTARKIVSQTFSPYEVFVSAALIYLAITYLIVRLFRYLEHKANAHLRRPSAEKPFSTRADGSNRSLQKAQVS